MIIRRTLSKIIGEQVWNTGGALIPTGEAHAPPVKQLKMSWSSGGCRDLQPSLGSLDKKNCLQSFNLDMRFSSTAIDKFYAEDNRRTAASNESWCHETLG